MYIYKVKGYSDTQKITMLSPSEIILLYKSTILVFVLIILAFHAVDIKIRENKYAMQIKIFDEMQMCLTIASGMRFTKLKQLMSFKEHTPFLHKYLYQTK